MSSVVYTGDRAKKIQQLKEATIAKHLSELKGVTEDLSARLTARGIKNSEQFLEATRTPASRQELAKALGTESKLVLGFANRADLARVKGIGGVFGDMLEEAGVDTVKELATRKPDNLHAKIVEVNQQKKLSTRTPKLEDVKAWVEEAKILPKVLEY